MTRTPNVKFHWFFWFFFKPFLNRTCIYFFCKLGSAWDISSRCGTGLLWVYSTTVFEFYSHCHRDQVADAKCSVDKEHWKSLDYLNAQKKGFLHCKMKWLFHLMATYLYIIVLGLIRHLFGGMHVCHFTLSMTRLTLRFAR